MPLQNKTITITRNITKVVAAVEMPEVRATTIIPVEEVQQSRFLLVEVAVVVVPERYARISLRTISRTSKPTRHTRAVPNDGA